MLAHIAVADGEYQTRPEPFIDLLLAEDVVKECPQSLLSNFLLVAIEGGESILMFGYVLLARTQTKDLQRVAYEVQQRSQPCRFLIFF